MNKEVAIDEAIDWAVKENLLEGLIKEQRAEVRMDKLTPEEIAQAQGLPLEKVLELKEQITVKA